MSTNQNKYNYIANELRGRIFDSVYSLDQPIPDEMALAREFDCSRMTMKKALEVLVLEGLIYRKRGHGTFIIKSALELDKLNVLSRETTGLTKTAKGKKVTSKIIKFDVGFPKDEVLEHLNINRETPVYHIIRLRCINNEPYVIEETYMPTTIIKGITEKILYGSIYSYVQEELGYTITNSHKRIRADKSNELDQEYLNCKTDDPVLEVEHVGFFNDGTPFEYSFARHRYDKFVFTAINIKRNK